MKGRRIDEMVLRRACNLVFGQMFSMKCRALERSVTQNSGFVSTITYVEVRCSKSI